MNRLTSHDPILFQNVLVASVFGTFFLITTTFLLKQALFHRTTVIFFFGISFLLLLLKRWFAKYYLGQIRQRGKNSRNILIVGSKKRARILAEQLTHHAEYGYTIACILDPSGEREGEKICEHVVEGQFENFEKIVKEKAIDEVFFAMPTSLIHGFYKKVEFLTSIGINFHILMNLDAFTNGILRLDIKPFVDEIYGLPVVSYHSSNKKLSRLYAKSVFEFIASAGIFLVFSPIFIIVPILIKFTSPGPIFFKQERIGYNGREFKLFKFRTMYQDAEKRLAEIEHLNEQSGPAFKITNDPRITKIGKYLRKFSIDELPQLFNVFFGHMCLVGPRPPLPNEVNQYKPEWRRRLSMKPGITGLWQISGRNDLEEFEEWVKLDLEYIDNWSFALDIKIILKTIPAMIFGTGR